MDSLQFNYNWNNKLDCIAFTSIRLRNDKKYQVGKSFYVNLNLGKQNILKGSATLIDIKHLRLSQINNYIAYLDTGYPPDKCKQVIQTMYKNANPTINWDTQELSLLLFVKEKTVKE
jgi:hypothetical protein